MTEEPSKHERLTANLWPETGQVLGLGKNATYQAAKRGEIPVMRFGNRLLVPRVWLKQILGQVGPDLDEADEAS